MIAVLLMIVSICVCTARKKSKWNSLNQANVSMDLQSTRFSEVDTGNEQQLALASTEVSYEYVRSSSSCQDMDDLVTKQNLAYGPMCVKMSPNVAYRNKIQCHNPLTESLLQSDEYAYISRPT